MDRLKGKDLKFISVIHRDGSGTTNVENDDMSHYDNDYFRMSHLSLSRGTYIASEMNSYVVKLKNKEKKWEN